MIAMVVSTSIQVYAHGLSKENDRTILIQRNGVFMAKVVVYPQNIEFVRPNFLTVSIIDTEKAEHFYGKIKILLSIFNDSSQSMKLSQDIFSKGLFKIPVSFKEQGRYQLILSLEEINMEFPFVFEVKDEKITPIIIAGCTALLFFLFIAGVFFIKRNR
jgi:hypothetical protein